MRMSERRQARRAQRFSPRRLMTVSRLPLQSGSMHGPQLVDHGGPPPQRSDSSPISAYEILGPATPAAPLVVASPHSGSIYPDEFVAASRLDPLSLRRSEDSFVDELFAGARDAGAPLIRALFPRAYLDLNREPFELDPRMFEDALPHYVTTRSARVSAGLGTIARVVANGQEIYSGKLRFSEALQRISMLHMPYHRALKALVVAARERFGHCILIDAHSMPSAGAGQDWDLGRGRIDVVLGDCHGTSCIPVLTEAVESLFADMGYTVARNEPYPGGFTTRPYGRPHEGVHALQIEVNRALYMDESTFERTEYFSVLTEQLTRIVDRVAQLPLSGSASRAVAAE